MTQVNKTTPSMREQYAATVGFRSSLESLMVVGQTFLAKPSMEDSDAVAFTTLTEDVLDTAGMSDEIAKIDGVDDPASKVELIMQDIIAPQLTTVAKLEEHLAEKAAGEVEQPFTTRDKMTAGPSLESLEQYAAEIGTYHSGLDVVRQMASMEGITADNMRGVALHFIKQVPEITTRLNISVEDLETTQVLGNLTDAVDRITQVVDNAREIAETKVSDARGAAAEATGADDGSDLGTKLSDKARETDESGVKVDEGVQVSSTTNTGNAPPADAADQADDTINADAEGGATGPAVDGTDGTNGTDDVDADEGAFTIEKTDEEEAAALAEAEAAAGSGDDTSGDDTNAGTDDDDDFDLNEPGAFIIEKTDDELAEEEAAAKGDDTSGEEEEDGDKDDDGKKKKKDGDDE